MTAVVRLDDYRRDRAVAARREAGREATVRLAADAASVAIHATHASAALVRFWAEWFDAACPWPPGGRWR